MVIKLSFYLISELDMRFFYSDGFITRFWKGLYFLNLSNYFPFLFITFNINSENLQKFFHTFLFRLKIRENMDIKETVLEKISISLSIIHKSQET